MFFSKSTIKLLQASVIVSSVALFISACDKSQFAKVETLDQKAAYSIGFNWGSALAAQTQGIDIDVVVAGLKDGFNGKEEKLDAQQRKEAMRAYAESMQDNMLKKFEDKNKAAGKAFLEENKTKEGVVETESGLQYKIISEGTGPTPKATDTVRVNYKGTLIDGSVFDESAEGKPIEFPLNRVIPGWTEGIQLLKEGGKAELYIPENLAYGKGGSGRIEPYSTLVFEVELLKVIPGDESAE